MLFIYYVVNWSVSLLDRHGPSILDPVFHSLEGDIVFSIIIVYKVLLNLNYLYI